MQLRKTVIAPLVVASFAMGTGAAFGQGLTNVPSANLKMPGVTSTTVLSPELAQMIRAQGSMLLENPADAAKYYGYLNDQPNLLPSLGSNVEATQDRAGQEYLSRPTRPEGRGLELRLRHAFRVPGT